MFGGLVFGLQVIAIVEREIAEVARVAGPLKDGVVLGAQLADKIVVEQFADGQVAFLAEVFDLFRGQDLALAEGVWGMWILS